MSKLNFILESMMVTILLFATSLAVLNETSTASESPVINVPDDYKKIQWAVGNASEGTTIYVKAGTYYEHNITISVNGLKLVGENAGTTIIDGNGTGPIIFLRFCNETTITRCTIQNSGGHPGVLLDYSNDNCISDNRFYDCHIAIQLKHSCKNRIARNEISGNNGGIVLGVKSEYNIVSENTVTNNNEGINLLAYAHNNNVTKNIIANNWMHGVHVSLSNNNTIVENVITNNKNGIHIVGKFVMGINNTIVCNEIAYNNRGIYLSSLSSGNIFYHNNFVENEDQVYLESSAANFWDKGYPCGGNYWSDYGGADFYSGVYQNQTGSDGIGDHPYVIDENNTDHYPLTSKYLQSAENPPYFDEIALVITVSMAATIGVAIYMLKSRKPKLTVYK